MLAASTLQVLLSFGATDKNKERLEESGRTVMESIGNIRTVESLCAQGIFFNRYRDQLVGPYK